MKMKLYLIALGILFSSSIFADGFYPEPTSLDQPWSITASVGAGKYEHVYSKDTKAAIGRLALANELLLTGDIALGLELGVQNGNRMKLDIPSTTLAILDWLPVQTTLGPMLDLLVTAKSDPLAGSAVFAELKGGVVYRNWQIKNQAINDLSQLAGEIQAGFGYPITALANLNLLYQGVYGNDPNLQVNPVGKTATLANIPVLHAILLGLSVNL